MNKGEKGRDVRGKKGRIGEKKEDGREIGRQEQRKGRKDIESMRNER